MQVAPREQEHLFTIEVEGDHLVHVPDGPSTAALTYEDDPLGILFDSACGTPGFSGLYVADEYDIDAPDFCTVCAGRVAEEREFLAALKATDLADALAEIGVNVPVTIIPSNRPYSASRDRLFDPRVTGPDVDLPDGIDLGTVPGIGGW